MDTIYFLEFTATPAGGSPVHYHVDSRGFDPEQPLRIAQTPGNVIVMHLIKDVSTWTLEELDEQQQHALFIASVKERICADLGPSTKIAISTLNPFEDIGGDDIEGYGNRIVKLQG